MKIFKKIVFSHLYSRILLLLALIFSLSSVHADYGSQTYNASSPVQIEVIDDSGRALNQYASQQHNNGYQTQRTYLEAVKGKRYKLRIKNTSNKRIGVVVAVDGRNILNGKKSYLRHNEKMYVLDPYESASYKGWRTAQNQVNRFYFTSAGDSYSSAWGDHSAMGVIAVAAFNEKQRHYYNKKHKNNGKRSARRGYFTDESTGTGFGEETYSPSVRVHFKATSRPAYKHFFKYEWRNTLCKRGIVSCGYNNNYQNNNRFWPRQSYNEYVPYPPSPSYKKNRDWAHQFTRSWKYDYNRRW
ncbi:MAG: hypothetical protein V3U71_05990 [Cocleimonas sp.]